MGLPAIIHSFAFNKNKEFINKKQDNSIRVVSWNVGLMNFTAPDKPTAARQNLIIFDELKSLNADVICLQEFFSAVTPGTGYDFRDSIAKTLGYPYHFFSLDNPYFDKQYYSGSIIYSKHKILENNRYLFPDMKVGAVIKVSLLVNKDTIDVFTTRLQSMGFQPYEYKVIDNIKKADNDAFKGSGNVVRKLKYGYSQKYKQVNFITQLLKNNQRPVIFSGDFNDVPTSYAYNKISRGMKDAWLTSGYGIGRTFKFISPTLRIDYILYNQYFSATQTQRIITTASDHYGLVTDIFLQKKAE